MRKILLVLQLITFFACDLVVAVLQVGSWIFRPLENLKPAIIRMPLEIRNKNALWILSLIIFLIPGSLVVDLSEDENILYIHFFHSVDPEASIQRIRTRFERRLKVLFEPERGLS